MTPHRFTLKTLAAAAAVAGFGLVGLSAQAADTIKVGVLHALSGTMAISETALKDMALMTIEDINAKAFNFHLARRNICGSKGNFTAKVHEASVIEVEALVENLVKPLWERHLASVVCSAQAETVLDHR